MSAQLAGLEVPGKIGPYRAHEVIGRGGSSVVYRASNDHCAALPPVVAIKVAHNEHCADVDFRRQFRQQTRVSAAIEHPGVLPVFDSGEDDGRPYVVMPHILGADLAHRLTGSTLTVGRILALLRQVADGLDALHHSGVLHLDVKPANVLVGRVVRRHPGGGPAADEPERAFVTDLGLCRFLADPLRRAAVRRAEVFVGSPRYASPEHLRGRAVRPSSDGYSLACLLFACLAGQPPYVGDVPTVVTGHLSGRVPSLSALTALPRCLDRVIRRGMDSDPGSRFGSCAELINAARMAILDGRT